MPYQNPTNRMMALVLAAGLFFWVLPVFFDGTALQTLFNSLVFGIATTVLTTWGSAAFYALRGNITAEHQHIVSTVAVWFIVWAQRLYAMVYIALDRPPWLQYSAWPAFITYMFGMTGVLIIAAPFFVKTVHQKDYYWQFAVGVLMGTVLAVSSYIIQITN